MERWPINRKSVAGQAFLDRKPVHVHDLLSAEGDEFPDTRRRWRAAHGTRSILSVPLLREDESIGAIVLRRTEVHPFSEKQIALLQTFADQAVIAIGNVRLFEEVQAKTRDLTEALEQQTATTEVLEVISSTPGDLAPGIREDAGERYTGLRGQVRNDGSCRRGRGQAGSALQCASCLRRCARDTDVSTSSERRPWPSDQDQTSGSYRGSSDEPGILGG